MVDQLVLGCTHFGGHDLEPPSDEFINSFNVADFTTLGPVGYTARISAHNYTKAWVAANPTAFDAIVRQTMEQPRPFRILIKQMGGASCGVVWRGRGRCAHASR